MNICFCVNENYAIYLYVALASILKNAKKSDKFHFFIFNPDLSETSKAELLKLKKQKDFDIEFITIDPERELADFPIWKEYNSKLAHYRFLIPHRLEQYNIDKCLYIDADIIVKQSLSDLYNTNLGINPVGLVPCGWGKEEYQFIPKLNLSKKHKYTYSGLMLFNMKQWKKQNIFKKINKIAIERGNQLHWPDMDILNIALDGNNYKELHPKYSINPGFKGFQTLNDFFKAYMGVFDKATIEEAYYYPIIWQMAGGAKPCSKASLNKIKKEFYNFTQHTIWEKQARKWLPKSMFYKLFKQIGKFFWNKKITIIDGIKIKKYKIFGITLYKKYKSISQVGLQLINIKETEKCLCMCPHADDEIIGLGGLLLKYPKNFDVLCVNSSGVAYKELSAKERSDIRISEFNSVMDTIGVNKYWIFEGYGNPPMFKQIDNNFMDYLNSIDLKQYDYVFVPYMNDAHPEHQYLTKNVFPKLYKIQGLKKGAKIVMYEVWTPIQTPNAIVNIDEVIEKKISILRMYKSQIIDGWDYDRWTKALNAYRSMQAKGIIKTKYAEVFIKTSADRFIKNVKK